MKISAYHKKLGDSVEWYMPMTDKYDMVYLSRVFSDEYTKPYQYPISADIIVRGGSGYAIKIENDQEVYHPELDKPLPLEIDHIYPDYELYGITDTAYGFLTKGCPRQCPFCHVKGIQGTRVYDFADLSEFWNGQKEIKLLDPNLTASKSYERHMHQLADSKAYVDFTQGLDVRMMDKAHIDVLNTVKFKRIHFAWDNPKDDLKDKFRLVSENLKGFSRVKVSCYVLTNYQSTFEQDLYRVQTLRELGIQPYVMIYRKNTAPDNLRKLQRWCNPFIFWKCKSWEEYKYSKGG